MLTVEQVSMALKRAAQAVKRETRMRELLIGLQDAQQIDLQALNELQLRIQARKIAIAALEATFQVGET